MKIKTALALSLPVALPASVLAQVDPYDGRYTPCVNYYVVGESPCQPMASTPLPAAPSAAPTTTPPATAVTPAKSEVDQYLENYGKPPREFVEFYLHPSPENAMKWVTTYNNLIQRSQSLSRSWSQADNLYQTAVSQGLDPMTVVSSSVKIPSYNPQQYPLDATHAEALADAADAQAAQMAHTAASLSTEKKEIRLGAFADTPDQNTPQDAVHLTYYFSATCPYCAKMTPELSSIFNDMKGKLTLTCVDVTPLSTTHKADPSNIEGKLPCSWRTPKEDEVESVPVQQTPTMLIQRGDAKPVRLSGYVPASTLMLYLRGTSAPPAGASTVPPLLTPPSVRR